MFKHTHTHTHTLSAEVVRFGSISPIPQLESNCMLNLTEFLTSIIIVLNTHDVLYISLLNLRFFFLVCCYSISFEIVCRMLFVFNMYSKSIKRTVSHRSEISLVCVNIVRMIVFFLLRFVCIVLCVFGEYIIFK